MSVTEMFGASFLTSVSSLLQPFLIALSPNFSPLRINYPGKHMLTASLIFSATFC